MEENDKCIDKALVEENYYYLNEENNKYVSCSKISGCEKCNSSTQCISCQIGFNFNDNNLCKKTLSKSELTSAQICGIVIGCVGIILIFAFAVLFLSRKSNFSKVKLDTNSSKYEGNKNTDEG